MANKKTRSSNAESSTAKAPAEKPPSAGAQDNNGNKPARAKKTAKPRKQKAGESSADQFPLVGIGSSAGGLSALKSFFKQVPEDSGLSFVVVMHLSPDFESHLAELLQPHVKVSVEQVSKTTLLEKNRVYVIPPGANLDTIDTHLRLTKLETSRQERAPIDHFFRKLAKTHNGNAIGIILTGTGSDGTLGIREIKKAGGLCIVQDPTEAEFDGMPQSAIATGLVDLVLPISKMFETILGVVNTSPKVPALNDGEELDAAARSLLQKIFKLLRGRTGRDFSRYKVATILRRIQRRMQLCHLEELSGYLNLLSQENEEAQVLADDLLITVTSFFRDPEVWENLERTVIPRLFEGKDADDQIRVWSAGCASGEEAYSLAMLLVEEVGRQTAPPQIQVFASDLHEQSLIRAREGFYAGDIEKDVSPERIKRFFVKDTGGYRIRKELRDIVVFAPHNLLGDPPFSRLDLVLCRNVLIYIQREAQRDLVELFHYALKPGGFLILGTSETVENSELFHSKDKKTCVYLKRNVPAPKPRLPVFPLARAYAPEEAEQRSEEQEPIAYGALHQRMVNRFSLPSVLVSPNDKIVHLSENAGRYFVNPGGEPTVNIFKLVRNELQIELRSAIHAARRKGQTIETKNIPVKYNGDSVVVTLQACPSLEPNEPGFVLVIFTEQPASSAPDKDSSHQKASTAAEGGEKQIREMDIERKQLQQRLETIIEEYENSQEEMKASNEEMQSTNEELRSTMEELETSKEELQSMNEELQTVNQENRHKVEELSQLSSDLQNLLTATEIATLFLDREIRIMRFTPRVGELFNVRMTDRGRPLSDFTHRLGYDQLLGDAHMVLDKLVPIEREVEDELGRWYLTRVMPYRSVDDRIEGVVITFVEITGRKRVEQQLADAKEYAEKIVETLHEPLIVLFPDLTVKSCNQSFYEHFRVRPEDTEGQKIWQLGNGQWNIPALRDLLHNVLPVNNEFNDYEVVHDFEELGHRVMLLNGRRLDHEQLILLGVRDITDRKQADEALRASEQRLQSMLNIPGVGVITFDPAGTVIDANDWFLTMTGYDRKDVQSKQLTRQSMTPPQWVEESERLLRELEKTGRIGPYEKQCFRKDGSLSWLLFAGAILDDGTIVEYCIDVCDRKEAEKMLRESEERLRLAAEATGFGSYDIDLGRGVMLWTEELRRIYDYRGKLPAKVEHIREMVHPVDQQLFADRMRKAADSEGLEGQEAQYRILRADGEVRWVRDVGRTIYSGEGENRRPVRVVGTVQDVTELREAVEGLKEADQRKNEFLAMLAHELRNPLAPIRTGLELLQVVRSEPERIDEIQRMMQRQTLQLITLVDDLLDVSRISRAKLELRKRRVLLGDIVQAAVEASRPFIEEAEHVITIAAPDEPVAVDADPHRLAQVLSNLLSNAAKYTPHGGQIWLTVEQQGQDIVLLVKDTGVGIPEDMLDRIFEMFTQVGRREVEVGLGIGLTLVKSLVEMHDGRIKVESGGPNQGSTFTVRLPIVADGPPELEETDGREPPKLSALRILIVDDRKAAVTMLSMALKNLGNEVRAAYDGEEAIKVAGEFLPDVIVMDIGMPNIDGYEAARRIRKQPWGEKMTLVALTGWGQDDDRRKTEEAGFDYHLVKPAEVSELQRVFAMAVSR